MKNIIKIVLIISRIILFVTLNIIYDRNNLMFISEENKKDLMEVLKIEDAPSFKPISRNSEFLGFGSGPNCYKLKFEISKDDYEKNNLKYRDMKDELDIPELDIHYKLKKDDTTYICVVRTSNYNEYTTQLYNAIINALK